MIPLPMQQGFQLIKTKQHPSHGHLQFYQAAVDCVQVAPHVVTIFLEQLPKGLNGIHGFLLLYEL
jgi:hypothetical protein